MDDFINEKKDMIYGFVTSKGYHPMKVKELASLMGVPKQERVTFKELVDSLISAGKLMIDGQGRIKQATLDTYTGTFSGTTRGFGFVTIDGTEGEDIFISPDDVGQAHDKDRVLIRIKEHSKGASKEGTVIKILERAYSTIIGTYQKQKSYGFVIPDNKKYGDDIFIPTGMSMEADTGSKVEVKLTSYGGEGKNPEGEIITVLGHISDPGTDLLSIVKAYGIPVDFPDDVIEQLKGIPDELEGNEYEGRTDLRDVLMVTIDSEDAKDLDDAVSLTFSDNMYHLGVHIADVSEYVKEKSPLDKEALKRGTSNYLIDSVIPMLPRKLSNGICSLNAGCDRLALSVLMDIDEKGNVIGHNICESVIRVDKRMNYTEVNKIITYDDSELSEKYAELVPMFKQMNTLASLLRERRMLRGSIDFDFPECKISVDSNGKPIDIKPYERNNATRLIEDFMLIANETVAEDYYWQELPFVYRTHENPDPEKMTRLGIFINNFGYTIKLSKDDIHPMELQKLITKIQGTEEENLIARLTLRSLKQARYTTTCEGHFGLAAKYYCHFTSPIRRYPDLQIHRIIKENLHGRLNDKRIAHYNSILNEVALSCSKFERRADEAEREVEKLKKVEYMLPFKGQIFEGVISGVTNHGLYVELPNTVEGTIDMEDLNDDYYIYNELQYQLVGEHTKKTYSLGQRITVKLIRADKMLRMISFVPVNKGEE